MGRRFGSGGRGPTGGLVAVVLWLEILRKRYFFCKLAKIDALAEDENDGSLPNGGDSDPAETTVGKPAIS